MTRIILLSYLFGIITGVVLYPLLAERRRMKRLLGYGRRHEDCQDTEQPTATR